MNVSSCSDAEDKCYSVEHTVIAAVSCDRLTAAETNISQLIAVCYIAISSVVQCQRSVALQVEAN